MIVVAGNLTIDDIVLPDGRTIMGTIGGDVLYSGLGAALWCESPMTVGLLTRSGDDFPAKHLDQVRAGGIDIEGVRPYPGPSIHYWVLYEWDSRRTYVYRSAADRFPALSPEPHDMPGRYATSVRAFHVAALPLRHAETLVRYAATLPAHPLVTLDTHEDFVAGYQDRLSALLPMLHVFLPSREEVALWFDDDDPEQHIGDLLDLGPRAVVIKMGAAGSLVQERGQSHPTHIPPVPVEVRDVTGAGDAFCGGFAAHLATTGNVIEAARAGAVAASFAVETSGSLDLLKIQRSDRDARMAARRPH